MKNSADYSDGEKIINVVTDHNVSNCGMCNVGLGIEEHIYTDAEGLLMNKQELKTYLSKKGIDVSYWWIDQMRKNGDLPSLKISERKICFCKKDIEKWLEQKSVNQGDIDA